MREKLEDQAENLRNQVRNVEGNRNETTNNTESTLDLPPRSEVHHVNKEAKKTTKKWKKQIQYPLVRLFLFLFLLLVIFVFTYPVWSERLFS
ncbi:Fe2+ transport system protein B [Texcoconibacillus texcoconensis]|uniref:Fe2+ transport system protein B n=1 Tax=Texcoconibacillus texcoconensis TaxID=1095777 RepID=A0A840QNI2_9BACI|nr:Fe2+ transport system protein B [Texcoconibacillus texcoconensis]